MPGCPAALCRLVRMPLCQCNGSVQKFKPYILATIANRALVHSGVSVYTLHGAATAADVLPLPCKGARAAPEHEGEHMGVAQRPSCSLQTEPQSAVNAGQQTQTWHRLLHRKKQVLTGTEHGHPHAVTGYLVQCLRQAVDEPISAHLRLLVMHTYSCASKLQSGMSGRTVHSSKRGHARLSLLKHSISQGKTGGMLANATQSCQTHIGSRGCACVHCTIVCRCSKPAAGARHAQRGQRGAHAERPRMHSHGASGARPLSRSAAHQDG